ncbi:MAG: MFS transporter, partial [Treponema sp.]|nr:MFS transporter [Candidatus Treponema equifaecale]
MKLKDIFRDGTKYKIFFITLLLSGLAYGIQKGMIDNYLAEIVAMGEFDRGLTEFFRELPGFMLIFILAALFTFSAEKLYKLGAVILLIGMGLLSVVPPSRVLVTLGICVASLGEHIQLGMKNTLSLEYSQEGKGGVALGYQNATYQIGTLAGYAVIFVAFLVITQLRPFKPFFMVSTAIYAVSMVFAFRLTGNSSTDKTKSRFYFKKKFTKFYFLEIFYGARKQVFFTFGPYVLILFYKANTSVISLLFAVSAVLCFFLSPQIGKLIDKIGYKVVMVSDTLILVIVCFFYGFAHHIFPQKIAFIVCCVNYILDSIISLASMASNVYVQDISDSKEEMKLTISTGISVNHLITIM